MPFKAIIISGTGHKRGYKDQWRSVNKDELYHASENLFSPCTIKSRTSTEPN